MSEAIKIPASASLPPQRANSAWAPLGDPLFRSLWIAAVISYTGTWMQNVGAGWLMTQLTMSPLMVSLVTAATTLPVFLVILPAVALNSVGFNVARAIGPALGGLVIAAAGSGIAFLLNAASFFGVIFFLYR